MQSPITQPQPTTPPYRLRLLRTDDAPLTSRAFFFVLGAHFQRKCHYCSLSHDATPNSQLFQLEDRESSVVD
mgnify:CR=1 FL=1